MQSASNPVMAIFPTYEDQANSTHVLYTGGHKVLRPHRAATELKHFARLRGLHLPYLRQAGGNSRQHSQPLPIDELHTFIPIKVRENPQGRDGAYGYFNVVTLQPDMLAAESRRTTLLHLPDHEHQSLRLFCSFPVLISKISEAWQLHQSRLWTQWCRIMQLSNMGRAKMPPWPVSRRFPMNRNQRKQ